MAFGLPTAELVLFSLMTMAFLLMIPDWAVDLVNKRLDAETAKMQKRHFWLLAGFCAVGSFVGIQLFKGVDVKLLPVGLSICAVIVSFFTPKAYGYGLSFLGVVLVLYGFPATNLGFLAIFEGIGIFSFIYAVVIFLKMVLDLKISVKPVWLVVGGYALWVMVGLEHTAVIAMATASVFVFGCSIGNKPVSFKYVRERLTMSALGFLSYGYMSRSLSEMTNSGDLDVLSVFFDFISMWG